MVVVVAAAAVSVVVVVVVVVASRRWRARFSRPRLARSHLFATALFCLSARLRTSTQWMDGLVGGEL